ncbi:hypothetical protein AB1L30_18905 [Bremerella sp. JC817]|uniref:hypothetical protein n=1 Tax=Bremerella sp. JC817 TaxID=3231756 RepID=UPI003458940E
MKRSPRCRRGFVTVIVLVAMVAAVLIATASLSRVTTQTSSQRRNIDQSQVDLLAEAGISLAQVRLAQDAAYSGETWNLAAGAQGMKYPATVTIKTSESDQPSQRKVEVDVQLGDNPARTIRAKRTINLSLPESEQE